MKDFFEGLASLFVDYLFAPYDMLRELELDNWWVANIASWLFIIIGLVAMVYWTLQLKKFDDKGEEDKSITAHSFL